MRIAALRLRVADPKGLAEFYRRSLGMTVRPEGKACRIGYPGRGADIVLLPGGGSYVQDRGQRYWKIGITLPDIDSAADHLRRLGVNVTEPAQFLDIGYMCHLSDPEGFAIELLQHDFESNRSDTDPATDPFASACLGQITLRTGDVTAEDKFCRALGLRLLSMQDVAPHGFDLHFYGFTDDVPPNPDLWSVSNREWLWKRPYTTLEYQHMPDARFVPTPDFRGIEIEGLAGPVEDPFGNLYLPA